MHVKWNHVCISGFGIAQPDEVWSSANIEQRLCSLYGRLNLPEGRLELMTGIRERRHWAVPMMPSEAATLAARDLIEKLGVDPKSIDCVVHAAVCRDRLEPATAAYVHGALGMRADAAFFDLSNACLGVVQAMTLVASWIEAGVMGSVLIVAGENGRALLEDTIRELLGGAHTRQSIKPYFANLTIGSGGVAILLTHVSWAGTDALHLKAAVSLSDTDARFLCQGGDSLQMMMQTDSEAMLLAGVRLAKQAWQNYQAQIGWGSDDLDLVVTHQVGREHRRKLYETLRIDGSKDFSIFESWGNIGSAAAPMALAKAVEAGRVPAQGRVAVLGIGSGLSTCMLALEKM